MKKELRFSGLDHLDKEIYRKLDGYRPKTILKTLEKLYKTGIDYLKDGDDENALILFTRFYNVFNHMKKNPQVDEVYLKISLGYEYTSTLIHIQDLRKSLKQRYTDRVAEVAAAEASEAVSSEPAIVGKLQFEPSAIEPDDIELIPTDFGKFISCKELYRLSKQKLVICYDLRASYEYKESRIKNIPNVNIPGEILKPGMSANKLGQALPEESKELWNQRDSVDLVVVFDRDSKPDTVARSRVPTLMDIMLNWDPDKHFSRDPVILDGGYVEYLQIYPMHCINPHVRPALENSLLTDLLDIDSIAYPEVGDSVPASVPQVPPTIDRSTKPVVSEGKRDVEFGSYDPTVHIPVSPPASSPASDRRAHSPEKMGKVNEDDKDVPAVVAHGEDREHDVAQPPRQVLKRPAPPTVDRSSKPKDVSLTKGLSGLTNEHNNCFMNSVLQVLANLETFSYYFLFRSATSRIHSSCDTNGEIVPALTKLLRQLWMSGNREVSIGAFRDVICKYAVRYARAAHEDAHEFLIMLLEWIHQETINTDVPPIKAGADGSIVNLCFTGFLRSTITCDRCNVSSSTDQDFRELIFELPTNHYECTLEDCVKKFLYTERIHGFKCVKCNTKTSVTKRLRVKAYPHILVIVLSRYKQNSFYKGTESNFEKNSIAVKFPLKGFSLNDSHYFNLTGVINHSGTTTSGHYTAYCKHPTSSEWYSFNDTVVQKIDPLRFDCTLAYVLIYSYTKTVRKAKVQKEFEE